MLIVLYALTAILYGGLALAVWRAHLSTGFEPAQNRQPSLSQPAFATLGRADSPSSPAHPQAYRTDRLRGVVLALALVLHGALLHQTIFPPDRMIFGFAYALSAMLWLGALIYWIESFLYPVDGLALLVLPLACLGTLMPAIFGGVKVLDYAADPLFKAHFLIAILAYGLLTLAALHAILMLLLERRLHRLRGNAQASRPRGSVSGWLDALPPLLTLEKLLFRLIFAGFIVLTLTLISGIWFSHQYLDQALLLDHKTVFSVISWLMFGAVLVGRRRYGWRGRVALRWVVAAFVALLLAYVGSRFVFEVLLHRPVV